MSLNKNKLTWVISSLPKRHMAKVPVLVKKAWDYWQSPGDVAPNISPEISEEYCQLRMNLSERNISVVTWHMWTHPPLFYITCIFYFYVRIDSDRTSFFFFLFFWHWLSLYFSFDIIFFFPGNSERLRKNAASDKVNIWCVCYTGSS